MPLHQIKVSYTPACTDYLNSVKSTLYVELVLAMLQPAKYMHGVHNKCTTWLTNILYDTRMTETVIMKAAINL